ncbi:DUF922 domain-containing protein [Aureimonas altamirensis]|nr:DUF922 domain-containing protein [Aureimonas altamirensis]MCM2505045.1 DUF922 domain-containing protein [Aureimonas altamirensis]
MRITALAALMAALSFAPSSAVAWTAQEVEEPYAVAGRTGIELYNSIGERGPSAGASRAIAVTTFKLTWQRDYQPRDGGCVLASARPRLVITYRLPKPSQRLSPDVAESWRRFIDGMRAHERVHGEHIVDMVRQIEEASVGLSVPGDPSCKRIREVLTERLGALSQAQRARSRAFDQMEMSDGGNVHRLILALVNGP